MKKLLLIVLTAALAGCATPTKPHPPCFDYDGGGGTRRIALGLDRAPARAYTGPTGWGPRGPRWGVGGALLIKGIKGGVKPRAGMRSTGTRSFGLSAIRIYILALALCSTDLLSIDGTTIFRSKRNMYIRLALICGLSSYIVCLWCHYRI